MPDNAIKTNTEMAAELGISAQTLKNWTRDFAPFLSAPGPLGENGRRFSEDDVYVLKRIKDHLAAGLTFEETAEELRNDGYGVPMNGDGANAALTVPNAQQGFGVLTDTLRVMIENQQTVQNSLQVNRNLLGVIIQDNFNLKEENAKLRERMLKLEQELGEMKKRDTDYRLVVEQRMMRVENTLRAEANKSFFQKLFGG
ncbi:MAG TPA: MerR family transcriptional regulator [Anaerolineae bacterium]|nr:MerR family transcriptional regulator [Anaerolineae bacterium]